MEPALTKPVVHLELHTQDLPRARDFYSELCGWSPEQIVHRFGTYLAMDLGRGAPAGGIVECRTSHPLWLPYVEVADVEAATARARSMGATVLVAPRGGPAAWRSVVSPAAAGEIAFWQPKG